MVSDFQNAGETSIHDQNIAFIQDAFLSYLRQLEQHALGIDLKPGFLPQPLFG